MAAAGVVAGSTTNARLSLHGGTGAPSAPASARTRQRYVPAGKRRGEASQAAKVCSTIGRAFAAAAAVALTAAPTPALMIAQKSPTQRALSAEVVVVGKVTAVEKDAVEAAPFPAPEAGSRSLGR